MTPCMAQTETARVQHVRRLHGSAPVSDRLDAQKPNVSVVVSVMNRVKSQTLKIAMSQCDIADQIRLLRSAT